MGARSEPRVAFPLQTHSVLKHEHLHWVGKAQIGVGDQESLGPWDLGIRRDISDLPGYKQHCVNKAINTACFGNASKG